MRAVDTGQFHTGRHEIPYEVVVLGSYGRQRHHDRDSALRRRVAEQGTCIRLQPVFAGREGQMAGIVIRAAVAIESRKCDLHGADTREHVALGAPQRRQAEFGEAVLQSANIELPKRDVMEQVAGTGREIRVHQLQFGLEA